MPAGLEKLFEKIGTRAEPGEFLPVPGLTEERKGLLRQMDEENHQKTYPQDYPDQADSSHRKIALFL